MTPALRRTGDAAFDAAASAAVAGGAVAAVPAPGRVLRALVRPFFVTLPLVLLALGISWGMGQERAAAGWILTGLSLALFVALQLPSWIPAARILISRCFVVIDRDALFVSLHGVWRIPWGFIADAGAPISARYFAPERTPLVLMLRNGVTIAIADALSPARDAFFPQIVERLDAAPIQLPDPTGEETWERCLCGRLARTHGADPRLGFEGFVEEELDGRAFLRCRSCSAAWVEYAATKPKEPRRLRQRLTEAEFDLYRADPKRAEAELSGNLDALLTDQRLEDQRERTYVQSDDSSRPRFIPFPDWAKYW